MKKDDKVVPFTGITTLDFPPETIISAAQGKLDEVVIIGVDKEGKFYFCSSMADGGTVLWLLEKAKKMLLEYEP